jgi:alkylation response protein AidB-like acyl-CoA dehydrogenase
MDFGLSEEQRLLTDTLRRYLEEHVPLTRIRELVDTETAHDPALWQDLVELGIPGILIPVQYGGSGLSFLDVILVAESLGQAATPTPFLGTGILAPVALLTAGTPAQQTEWLPRLASGQTRSGMAMTEVVSRREAAGVRLEDGKLYGKALFVMDAATADIFLVVAGSRDLVLVPRETRGLELELLRTIDQTRPMAELRFEGVMPVEYIGGPSGARTAIARVLEAGRIALAADTLGACERAMEMAINYAKERYQFGRPIGSFQAVKHMCAEMVAAVEPARSLLWYAAYAFDAVPDEASHLAPLVKAHLAEVGTMVVKTATEVHGGIGFTDEYPLHLLFKRVGLNRQLLGGPELLRAQVAVLQGWVTV